MKFFEKTVNLNKNKNLAPGYITGFSDGEGCFHVLIQKHSTCKTGWRVRAFFSIHLHGRDKALLKRIREYFSGSGSLATTKSGGVIFRITDQIQLLHEVIPHFDKYPLLTKKRADYELWKQIVGMLNRKEHLTNEGLLDIVNIRASINGGCSEELKAAFPDIRPYARPEVELSEISDPNWILGFTEAEGNYLVHLQKDTNNKSNLITSLRFQLTQHLRDKELMDRLETYFDCGNVVIRSAGYTACDYQVRKFLDITEKIIPFFEKYPLIGMKSLDFKDFKRVAEMIKQGPLTEEDREIIKQIKIGMNKGRK